MTNSLGYEIFPGRTIFICAETPFVLRDNHHRSRNASHMCGPTQYVRRRQRQSILFLILYSFISALILTVLFRAVLDTYVWTGAGWRENNLHHQFLLLGWLFKHYCVLFTTPTWSCPTLKSMADNLFVLLILNQSAFVFNGKILLPIDFIAHLRNGVLISKGRILRFR